MRPIKGFATMCRTGKGVGHFAKKPSEGCDQDPAAAVLCGYIPGGRLRECDGEVLEGVAEKDGH